MPYPTLLPLLAQAAIGDHSPVTLGLAGGLGLAFLAYGEARVHVSGLREWKREAAVEIASLRAQVASLEVRDGRTAERLDYMARHLVEIGADVKSLLQRRDVA